MSRSTERVAKCISQEVFFRFGLDRDKLMKVLGLQQTSPTMLVNRFRPLDEPIKL